MEKVFWFIVSIFLMLWMSYQTWNWFFEYGWPF